MPFFKYLDEHSDITDILFKDRKRFAHTDKFTQDILRGDSPFSVLERELIAAYVSGLNECQFCHGIHKAVAENFGLPSGIIEDLIADIDQANVDEKLKPVLHYVKKLTLTPSKMVEADAQRVYEAGWSEQALYDAICICGIFNFYNRLLDGHGIKGYDKIYQFGAKHLSKSGYVAPWFIGLFKKQLKKSKMKFLLGG